MVEVGSSLGPSVGAGAEDDWPATREVVRRVVLGVGTAALLDGAFAFVVEDGADASVVLGEAAVEELGAGPAAEDEDGAGAAADDEDGAGAGAASPQSPTLAPPGRDDILPKTVSGTKFGTVQSLSLFSPPGMFGHLSIPADPASHVSMIVWRASSSQPLMKSACKL